MSRPFQFKQFTIQQYSNAMKVSTDACIFGSIIAKFLSIQKNILYSADIGAGTGLLSCMIQQKNPHLLIDAIEIEPSFCEEMGNNIKTCKFENHITIINQSLQFYKPLQQYDVIMSNPPFFSNQMLSKNAKRRQVRHAVSLTNQDIFNFAKNYLQKNGYLCLLLPYFENERWQEIACKIGFFLHRKINIKTQITKSYSRVILIFTVTNNHFIEDEVIYTDVDNQYSIAFKTFLKDYYLFL